VETRSFREGIPKYLAYVTWDSQVSKHSLTCVVSKHSLTYLAGQLTLRTGNVNRQ